MNRWHLKQACRCLEAGGIVAYPTEAIFGLGCNPLDGEAVMRLLAIKQRSWRKGLILIASEFAQVEPFLDTTTVDVEKKILSTPSTEAVTWLISAQTAVPFWLRGESSKLAIRVTHHPLAAALCQEWGGAIVSTSANISTRRPARNAWQVRHIFGEEVDYILPGALGGAKRPSQIRDANTGQVIRV